MKLWNRYILGRNWKVSGERNSLEFGEDVKSKLRIFVRGNDNRIVVGARTRILGSIEIRGDGHTVTVGDDADLRGATITCREGCGVRIGNGMLAAAGLLIRTSDSHSIFDLTTGERTNHAGAITIGDHVWLSQGVTIVKGVSLPSNCVVAAKSFVTKSFEVENVLIGGVPARVLKSGITWSRHLLPRLGDEI